MKKAGPREAVPAVGHIRQQGEGGKGGRGKGEGGREGGPGTRKSSYRELVLLVAWAEKMKKKKKERSISFP